MTFKRPCRECNGLFQPESKHNKVCPACKEEIKQRILKTRKRSYEIFSYKLIRFAKKKKKPSNLVPVPQLPSPTIGGDNVYPSLFQNGIHQPEHPYSPALPASRR